MVGGRLGFSMGAGGTSLWRRGRVVAGNSLRVNGIAGRLVFRGAEQVFTHKRNEISAFAAELVFCDVPGEFLQWGWDAEGFGVGRGCGVSLIDAVGGGVTGISPPPVCLCGLAADGLAFRLAAGSLAVADPWVRIEPP